jgi:nitrogen regulatory protein PII
VIVEAHKLNALCDGLRSLGISDFTTVEVGTDSKGCQENPVRAIASVRLVTVVSAGRAAEVILAFAGPGWRDLLGDGKIFIYEVAEPARVRTSETPEDVC